MPEFQVATPGFIYYKKESRVACYFDVEGERGKGPEQRALQYHLAWRIQSGDAVQAKSLTRALA
jgi:hypothetical protein